MANPVHCDAVQAAGKLEIDANTTNITFHGLESEALLILLDQDGICASSAFR